MARKRKQSMRALKRKAPKVPELTCPLIDDVIAIVDRGGGSMSKRYTLKKSDVRSIKKRMEEIRAANDRLRDSGRYWYEKTKEIVEPESMVDYE